MFNFNVPRYEKVVKDAIALRPQIEKAVDEIESTLSGALNSEVKSEYIGELVMAKLKEIDDVAYVRFASVYRQFTDIDTFLEEVKLLMMDKK